MSQIQAAYAVSVLFLVLSAVACLIGDRGPDQAIKSFIETNDRLRINPSYEWRFGVLLASTCAIIVLNMIFLFKTQPTQICDATARPPWVPSRVPTLDEHLLRVFVITYISPFLLLCCYELGKKPEPGFSQKILLFACVAALVLLETVMFASRYGRC